MRPPSRVRNGPELNAPGRGISVVNRPTTKQGLPSARTKTGTRQVADKSYYIGLLRNHINDLMAEIKRLTIETDKKRKDQANKAPLQQEVNTLKEQITQSEAELADYNVLSDRLNGKVSQDEMLANLNELIQSNIQNEKEVDRLYREKADMEAVVQNMEKQVNEMVRGQGSYQLKELIKEIEIVENQIKELRGGQDDLKGKSKEELGLLLKEATVQKGDIEKEIQDQTKSLQYMQQQIKQLEEMESELQTQRGEQYLKMLQREKEINQFNQTFVQSLDAAKSELQHVQKDVIDILNKTSRDIESIEKLPSVENYKQLQQDLQYKQRQMTDAKTTTAKLQNEVEQRRRELEDLQNVDKKIIQEEAKIQKEIESMHSEMPELEKVDQIREEGEIKKRKKTEERDSLQLQKEYIKELARKAAEKYKELKSQLQSNEIHNRLHEAEREIRARAAEQYTIVESIEEERRRTNYAMVKRHSLSIVQQINDGL